MDAREGMANMDGDDTEESATYSSGMDNPDTHWDMPIRYLPVELKVRGGDRLELSCTHNLHDLEQVVVSGVTPRMLGDIGRKDLLGAEIATKLGVVMEMAKAPEMHYTLNGAH